MLSAAVAPQAAHLQPELEVNGQVEALHQVSGGGVAPQVLTLRGTRQ
jgi:hypothetical protein